MDCPICHSADTRVLRTAGAERRRKCCRCGNRWSSIEVHKDDYFKQQEAVAKVRDLARELEPA